MNNKNSKERIYLWGGGGGRDSYKKRKEQKSGGKRRCGVLRGGLRCERVDRSVDIRKVHTSDG